MSATQVFDGRIAGVGTTSGVRLVVGVWSESPYGAFADVMVERPDGHRVLLAPTDEVAALVATTYAFDEVRVGPVAVTAGSTWRVTADALDLWFTVGRRTTLGWLVRLLPTGDREWVARAADPLARRLLPGVRTHGSAGGGRTEWYAARDVHRLEAAGGRLDGADLGDLAAVRPAVRFGFGSVPAAPGLTTLRSHVRG